MQTLHQNIIAKEVENSIIDLLIAQPFFGRLFVKMNKSIDANYLGISISYSDEKGFQLCINPAYWNTFLKHPDKNKTKLFRISCLKRQLIHFIFKHDLKIKNFENKNLFIVASELVANQFLTEEETEVIKWKTIFPTLEIPPFQSLEFYYNLLQKTLEKRTLSDVSIFNNQHFDRYKEWFVNAYKPTDKVDEALRDTFISTAINPDESLNDPALPKELIEIIKQLQHHTHRTIDWKKMLRKFYNSSSKTKLANTILRSSKRYGTFPGIRIRRRAKILVAVDTSASITTKDLNLFFNEIYYLWKQKAAIQIVECDTQIVRRYQYEGISPKSVPGRGNTDFNAPISYANEIFKPDSLIYFTDGFGPKPRIKFSNPLLWLISPDGIKEGSKVWNELPGIKIKMNSNS